MELQTKPILTKKLMENSIKLTNKHIELLEKLPEQGMGYQIVDITLKNGQILKDRVVLNSTYLKLIDYEKIDVDEIDTITLRK